MAQETDSDVAGRLTASRTDGRVRRGRSDVPIGRQSFPGWIKKKKRRSNYMKLLRNLLET